MKKHSEPGIKRHTETVANNTIVATDIDALLKKYNITFPQYKPDPLLRQLVIGKAIQLADLCEKGILPGGDMLRTWLSVVNVYQSDYLPEKMIIGLDQYGKTLFLFEE